MLSLSIARDSYRSLSPVECCVWQCAIHSISTRHIFFNWKYFGIAINQAIMDPPNKSKIILLVDGEDNLLL